jgi:hypothetical protein
MSDNKKKSYKEKNGTTRVGDFLRSINFSKVSEVVTSVLKGDIGGAIDVISNSKELSEEQVKMALKELEYDVIEMQEITKRWESDMASDSWLSKNIRPLSLAFLTLCLFIYIILDSSLEGFKIDKAWIDLLSSLLLLVYGGYFSARALEKITHLKNRK